MEKEREVGGGGPSRKERERGIEEREGRFHLCSEGSIKGPMD